MPQSQIAPLAAQQPQSTTDQVFDALYQAVISLQLPPGTKVSEAEIAQKLETSRQPVRDAFFRLSKLGFLSIRPQRATLITRISEQAVRDAVFVRVAIESECLRTIVSQREPGPLPALRALLSQQEAAVASPDRDRFHALDEEFHLTLCELAGHAHAWDLIREQKAHMDRIRFLTLDQARRELVIREHRALVEALEAGDAARAIANLRSHLHSIHQILHTVRERHADYFEDDAS